MNYKLLLIFVVLFAVLLFCVCTIIPQTELNSSKEIHKSQFESFAPFGASLSNSSLEKIAKVIELYNKMQSSSEQSEDDQILVFVSRKSICRFVLFFF